MKPQIKTYKKSGKLRLRKPSIRHKNRNTRLKCCLNMCVLVFVDKALDWLYVR